MSISLGRTRVIRSTTVRRGRCGYIQHYGRGCIHPQGGSPHAAAGTPIVIHPGCKEQRLYYCITSQGTFEIKHKTSGRCIQPQTRAAHPRNNERLVLNNCGKNTNKFRFTPGSSPQSFPWSQLQNSYHHFQCLQQSCHFGFCRLLQSNFQVEAFST